MVHGVARDDRVILAPKEWRASPLVLLLRPRESLYADIDTSAPLCVNLKRGGEGGGTLASVVCFRQSTWMAS